MPARLHVKAAQAAANDSNRSSSLAFTCANAPLSIRPMARNANNAASPESYRLREDRKRHDQGNDARKDQDFDWIQAHGRQGVDFFAHLHRPEFGGIGAARPTGDHDGDDQDADLAEHEDFDEVDDLRAELAEVEDALLGNDGADQEGNQSHDRYGLPADLMQVIDQRLQPE